MTAIPRNFVKKVNLAGENPAVVKEIVLSYLTQNVFC